MANTGKKWKKPIFLPKNAVFWFWPRNLKIRPFLNTKNSEISESGLRFAIYYQMETCIGFFGHFLAKNEFLVDGAHLQMAFSFGFSMGSNNHVCACQKSGKSAKKGQKRPKRQNGRRTHDCCYPLKIQKNKLFGDGLYRQKSHFWPKSAPKKPIQVSIW